MESEVGKSAFRFSLGTLVSRVTGLLREQTTAFFFGTSPLIAAFLVAYRIALSLRRLLGEGSLLIGFIPHFESLRARSDREAARFFRDIYISLSGLLIALIAVLEIGIYSLSKWGGLSQDNQQILFLSMLILPGLFFICLSALSSALLQCEKKFFLPGISPAIFNVAWIASIWIMPHATFYLALATVIAFFLQWVFLLPETFRFFKAHFTLREWLAVSLLPSELQSLLKALSFSVIGLGAVQINGILDTLFARIASLEGPAYLNYAMRLHQFPLALVAISISAALLPTLSRHLENLERFKELLRSSLIRAFLLMLPCTIGILTIGTSAVSLIYLRGHFTENSALQTTSCLAALGLGLIPMGFFLILSQGFYARKDFRTPVIGSLISVSSNFLLNALFVLGLGLDTTWIALGTSISSLLSCAFLLYVLSKEIGPIFDTRALISLFKITVCSICGGAASWGMHRLYPGIPARFFHQLLQFGLSSLSFLSCFLLSAYLLGLTDLLPFFSKKRYPQPNETDL